MSTTNLKSFNYLENGDVAFSVLDTVKTTRKLDSGVYNLSYLPYPESTCSLSQIKEEFNQETFSFTNKDSVDLFFDKFYNEDVFNIVREMGFIHKSGVLLHGKEGTGKTSIAKYYYTRFIKDKNAVVFYINNSDGYFYKCWEFIVEIRKIQDDPIIIILEELDGFMKDNEDKLKSCLDGNLSISNCVVFASTNHIDRIPEALKNRESRFKFVINIEGIQNKEEVFKIIKNMIGNDFSDEEINKYSEELKGKTLDEIKQFCLDKIMSIPVSEKKKIKLGFKR